MDKSLLPILLPFDILLFKSPSLIGAAIRDGETLADDLKQHGPIIGVVEGMFDGAMAIFEPSIPEHSGMVASETGYYEMTWPMSDIGDLIKDVDLIVGVYRCPWLTFEHNPECYHVLIDDLHDWWDQFIHSGEGYGLDNLLSFVTPLPEDKKHMVCSMATTLALIDCVNSDPRFPCNFPKDWIVAGKDNVPMVGLVSPLDQLKWFNQAGWGVWQDPAINKV